MSFHSHLPIIFPIYSGPDDLGRGNTPASTRDGNVGPPVACCVVGQASRDSWVQAGGQTATPRQRFNPFQPFSPFNQGSPFNPQFGGYPGPNTDGNPNNPSNPNQPNQANTFNPLNPAQPFNLQPNQPTRFNPMDPTIPFNPTPGAFGAPSGLGQFNPFGNPFGPVPQQGNNGQGTFNSVNSSPEGMQNAFGQVVGFSFPQSQPSFSLPQSQSSFSVPQSRSADKKEGNRK